MMAVNLCWKCFFVEPAFALRTLSSKVKLVGTLETSVQNSIESLDMKPRKHPGAFDSSAKHLPDSIQNAIKIILADRPFKEIKAEAILFNNYLNARKPPIEDDHVLKKRAEIIERVEESLLFDSTNATKEEVTYYNEVVKSKVGHLLKKKIYNWKMIDYNRHVGILYLASRAAPEYATLCRIFHEISQHMDGEQPKTLFDFGSGVGTVMWAAQNTWINSIKEYYCVETSQDMSNISSELLKNVGFNMNNIYYRQFLPSSSDRKFDIVVSAFSLLELPSASSRLQTIANLWNKTNKYLVIVERGSRSNFEVINEARDFLLSTLNTPNESSKVQIIAPCPHEKKCPRMSQDNTPCNFPSYFFPLFMRATTESENFTYIIFAKGGRSVSDHWPRIVRPVLQRGGHAVCKLCTPEGTLESITFSSTKPNKPTYRCAKGSKWGDLLPVKLEYVDKEV